MAIFNSYICMLTRPGTSHVPGICEAELRRAFQKSEGLLLRVMGLRASTSAANADGSSNEETRVLMHLDQVGAAAMGHGDLGIHQFYETSTNYIYIYTYIYISIIYIYISTNIYIYIYNIYIYIYLPIYIYIYISIIYIYI